MNKTLLRRLLATAFFSALLAVSGWAQADPPSRVARLAYVSGAASFSPGGERDWHRVAVNRPLVTGDRLWVDAGARAELQMGTAAVRVGGATSITLLNLDDRVVQVQLSQGTLNIRVRRLDRGHVFEVATPTLAYSIRRPGSYRIHVDPDGMTTTVTVRSGLAEVYAERRALIIAERQTYRFFGSGLRDYETYAVFAPDEFDRWSMGRDRRWDTSPSRRYVSAELIGYEDLDQNGSWRKAPDYGMVWVPHRVSADWAPYRDGHWAWVEPWGWTWIDDQPWGFAPSHYGRWARIGSGWAWVPGPATVRPVYAPALVAFVGGDSLRAAGGGGAVGWFPLAPREVYRPSYTVSREYFANVNTSNTVIPNRTVILNQYNAAPQTNVTYVNQGVPGAVVAMLAAAFAQSRPVAKETVRVTPDMVARAPTRTFAPVAPVQTSVSGAAPAAAAKPPENVQSRSVVAQVKPPPPPVPFVARQSALAANAGKPLDAAATAALKPAAPAVAPAVTVVAPEKPVVAPPKPASAPAPQAAAPAAPAPAPAAAPAPAPAPAPAASRPSMPPPVPVPAPAQRASAPAAPAPVPAPAAAPAPTPPAPASAPAARGLRPSASAPAAPAAPEGQRPALKPRPPAEERSQPASAPVAAPAAPVRPPAAAAPPPAPAPAPAAAPPMPPPPAARAPAPAAPPAAAPAPPPPAARAPASAPEAARPPVPAASPRVAPPPPPAASPPPVAPPPAAPRAVPPVPVPPVARASGATPAASAASGTPRAFGRREGASERRKREEEEQRKP